MDDLLKHYPRVVLAERGRGGQADISGQGREVAGVLVPGLVLTDQLAGGPGIQVDRVLGGEGLVQDEVVRAGVDLYADRPPAGWSGTGTASMCSTYRNGTAQIICRR